MPEDQLSDDAAEATEGESWFVLRPPTVLMEVPVAFRWEVTRRHPYYLRFWELAHRHHQQPSADPQQRDLEWSAVLILQGIGMGDDPPHPGTELENLGGGSLSQAWESGAVAPITLRGLVGLLLTALPPEARQEVGQFLVASGQPGNDATRRLYQSLTELNSLKSPELACFPRALVVGINGDAPQRVVVQAVEQLVRGWKEERNIPERRRRDDKLEDYLAVWDLREGWAGDRYHGDQEKTLRQIAEQLAVPLSTVANRYRSAFRLIVGRDYAPELWARVMGFLKVCDILGPELPRRTLRRPWRSPQRQPVSETVLGGATAGDSPSRLLQTLGVSQAETDYVDLVLDIQDLVKRGRSNEEIMAALELSSPEASEAIDYLRTRDADQL